MYNKLLAFLQAAGVRVVALTSDGLEITHNNVNTYIPQQELQEFEDFVVSEANKSIVNFKEKRTWKK